MAKYTLTESKLRDMIREAIEEAMMDEGLGWDTFKGSIKDVLKGDCIDPTKDEYKNFIKSGNAYNFDYDYYNPDNENQGTNNPTNWEGKPNKRINKGLRGKVGRAAAGAALMGANKLGKAWRKWGENVEDADSKPNPTYRNESKLRGMIREAVKNALNEGFNNENEYMGVIIPQILMKNPDVWKEKIEYVINNEGWPIEKVQRAIDSVAKNYEQMRAEGWSV